MSCEKECLGASDEKIARSAIFAPNQKNCPIIPGFLPESLNSSANQRFWQPGFGAGVYADEDNEEDIPRNAEMFETASILSAMQVLFF